MSSHHHTVGFQLYSLLLEFFKDRNKEGREREVTTAKAGWHPSWARTPLMSDIMCKDLAAPTPARPQLSVVLPGFSLSLPLHSISICPIEGRMETRKGGREERREGGREKNSCQQWTQPTGRHSAPVITLVAVRARHRSVLQWGTDLSLGKHTWQSSALPRELLHHSYYVEI